LEGGGWWLVWEWVVVVGCALGPCVGLTFGWSWAAMGGMPVTLIICGAVVVALLVIIAIAGYPKDGSF
jgi:hypothetical protein